MLYEKHCEMPDFKTKTASLSGHTLSSLWTLGVFIVHADSRNAFL